MSDPLHKPIAGEPFVPSAKQFGMFIESAQRAERASQELRGLVAEPDSGVVLVRNDTGADITHEHAVIAFDNINDVVIAPSEREGVVFERPVFPGITPVAEGTATKRFGILQQPLKDGEIGKAVVSGVSWVKLRGPATGYTDETLYANPVADETEYLQVGGSGPAKVLWHEGIASEQTGWGLVALGTDTPPLVKVTIIDEAGTFPNQLIEADTVSTPAVPVSARLLVWDELAGEWQADESGPALQVFPDPGFRGVAFVGDDLEVYYSRESNRWQAVNGGRTIMQAYSATTSPTGGNAYALIPEGLSPPDYLLITVDGFVGVEGAAETLFKNLMGQETLSLTVLWVGDRFVDPSSPHGGTWQAIAEWDTGCGLKFDKPAGQAIELLLDGNIAGKGLVWDEQNCELKLDSTDIDCTDLASAIPCCEGLCDRLDQIEQEIDELFDCCEENTNCCRFVLDNCCDGGSSSGSDGSDNGTDKSTAIVPASWSSTGYTALFVEECPEVRFDDVITVETVQRDGTVAIDPKYLEVCEPGSIEVCGTSCDIPLSVGARVESGGVRLRFAEQRDQPVRIVIRLTGIRKGFRGHRFPDRTRKQFEQNEAFLRSAYDA